MDQISPESDALGAWLSASLDDPKACDEFKRDVLAWFTAGLPPFRPGKVPSESRALSDYGAGYTHGFHDGHSHFKELLTVGNDDKGELTMSLEDLKKFVNLRAGTRLYIRTAI